ncbi:MAG TPA: histidine phosphatase family protein, partial [Vicinamibacterales bacterium]|nr:histidine phosphatase family protein [Vicinamibacterales bacterium]
MNVRKQLLHICLSLSGVIGLMLAPGVSAAQTLSDGALVTALRQGGFIILMRHASSPQQPPSRENANPDNAKVERQLDDVGRSTAIAMGRSLRDLRIPVGEVLSSPTYRALETARLAQWTNVTPVPELGDNGQGMTRVVPEEQSAWLKRRVTQAPTGTNTILVTHLPNIS